MPAPSIVFQRHLYPAIAPLPVPMANHLLLQEERRYRNRPAQRPTSGEIVQTVLERINQARMTVYDYLRPFVAADKKRQLHGESRAFPTPEWVVETLAYYTPNQRKNDETTLDYWQKKGLLRREKTRGVLDISSVAALLISRLAEKVHQRNWLPSGIEPEEPWWWCYGQEHTHAPIQPIPIPLPASLPASFILWTGWKGAMWEQGWPMLGDEHLYRWGHLPGLEDLVMWDEQLPVEIRTHKDHPLLGRVAVQRVLLEEARSMVLTAVVQKGIIP